MLFYLGAALGANAWLIKGFFDTVPRDLDESAQIDGATHNQTFFRIILPLAAPVLAIIFLLSFIAVAGRVPHRLGDHVRQGHLVAGRDGRRRPARPARRRPLRPALGTVRRSACCILAIPVVLLFQFLQRFIVSGITAGAVKG